MEEDFEVPGSGFGTGWARNSRVLTIWSVILKGRLWPEEAQNRALKNSSRQDLSYLDVRSNTLVLSVRGKDTPLIPVWVALGGVLEPEQSEEGVECRDCDGWARVLRWGG